nr:hypothetical protein CFP56_63155 [Quercus suber]
MVVVFAALENGFDRQGGLVDGEFGSRIMSLVSCLRVLAFGFRGDAVGEVVVGAEVGDVTGVGEFGFEGASAGAYGLEADGVAVVRVVRVVIGAVAGARALALLTMTQINVSLLMTLAIPPGLLTGLSVHNPWEAPYQTALAKWQDMKR